MRFKVLIVEDSKASREFIAATVESIPGLEAVQTASGFEALKILPRHRFELKYRPDIPKKVSLNEAVELGKNFGTEESSAFVNGLLDRIALALGKA